MKWKWADFWGFLTPKGDQERKKEPPRPAKFSFGWGTPLGKVVAVAMIVALFGGLAAWIIVRVVGFFGRFWGQADELVP